MKVILKIVKIIAVTLIIFGIISITLTKISFGRYKFIEGLNIVGSSPNSLYVIYYFSEIPDGETVASSGGRYYFCSVVNKVQNCPASAEKPEIVGTKISENTYLGWVVSFYKNMLTWIALISTITLIMFIQFFSGRVRHMPKNKGGKKSSSSPTSTTNNTESNNEDIQPTISVDTPMVVGLTSDSVEKKSFISRLMDKEEAFIESSETKLNDVVGKVEKKTKSK